MIPNFRESMVQAYMHGLKEELRARLVKDLAQNAETIVNSLMRRVEFTLQESTDGEGTTRYTVISSIKTSEQVEWSR